MRKTKPRIDRQELRENILRPSPYLGYDRDDVGVHLLDRGAYAQAEAFFRRAVWLNPYDVNFKIHLAGSLYRQQQYDEALHWVQQAIQQAPDNPSAQSLLQLIQRNMQPSTGEHETITSHHEQHDG